MNNNNNNDKANLIGFIIKLVLLTILVGILVCNSLPI